MKTKFFGFALLTLAMLSVQTLAQKKTGSDLRDAVERVDKASKVMTEVMSIAEKSIPRDLLAKADAVVVFPGAIKGAFIVGGQGGKGVAVRRVGKGWSAPAFFNSSRVIRTCWFVRVRSQNFFSTSGTSRTSADSLPRIQKW